MTAAKEKTTEKALPVATFGEAYEWLRRPFTPAAVHFKLQATWEGGAMAIAYIDARLASGRLNAVCPEIWSPEFMPHPSGKGLICKLTVGGITRTDYGCTTHHDEDIAVKGTFSDALKRAAVHFGVGESLYVLPKMVLREGEHLRKSNKGKYTLTDQGQGHLRNRYTAWLESGGVKAFGEPLDHGDALHEPEEEPGQVLADLIAEVGFTDGQVDLIRKWARNGKALDAGKVTKATLLLQAGEPEVLLERATVKPEPEPAEDVEPAVAS